MGVLIKYAEGDCKRSRLNGYMLFKIRLDTETGSRVFAHSVPRDRETERAGLKALGQGHSTKWGSC